VTPQIDNRQTLKELIADFDELLGVQGQWDVRPKTSLQTPDQVKELTRDLLTDLFGLEVRGL
jgi:hypothetical protein